MHRSRFAPAITCIFAGLALLAACSSFTEAPVTNPIEAGPADAAIVPTTDAASSNDAGSDAALDAGPMYEALVLADAPMHYFRLADAAPTAAADLVGSVASNFIHGNDCTANEPSALVGEQGIDHAMGFGGHSCYLPVAGALGFAGNAPFTLELWVKVSTLPTTSAGLVSNEGVAAAAGYSLLLDAPGTVTFKRGDASSIPITLSLNAWSHVVATYDGSTFGFFVNGAGAGVLNDGQAIVDGSGLVVGSRSGGTGFFAGQLDEVAIYGHALAIDRIRAHYTAGSGKAP